MFESFPAFHNSMAIERFSRPLYSMDRTEKRGKSKHNQPRKTKKKEKQKEKEKTKRKEKEEKEKGQNKKQKQKQKQCAVPLNFLIRKRKGKTKF
jgi:hypothetical protein